MKVNAEIDYLTSEEIASREENTCNLSVSKGNHLTPLANLAFVRQFLVLFLLILPFVGIATFTIEKYFGSRDRNFNEEFARALFCGYQQDLGRLRGLATQIDPSKSWKEMPGRLGKPGEIRIGEFLSAVSKQSRLEGVSADSILEDDRFENPYLVVLKYGQVAVLHSRLHFAEIDFVQASYGDDFTLTPLAEILANGKAFFAIQERASEYCVANKDISFIYPPIKNFGVVRPESEVSCSLSIFNNGLTPLTINSPPKTSCGCTTVDQEFPLEIASGKSIPPHLLCKC